MGEGGTRGKGVSGGLRVLDDVGRGRRGRGMKRLKLERGRNRRCERYGRGLKGGRGKMGR